MIARRVAQLKKLRSWQELQVRGRQELHKLRERLFHTQPTELSDDAFCHAFLPAARNGSSSGTATRLLQRLRERSTLFCPSLSARAALVATMEQRFPVERAALLTRAEKACRGQFALLGYQELDFGNPIDWHWEPRAGQRLPLVHWSQIDPVRPAPGVDPKIVWELNRHAHLVTLAQAYWLTGEPRFADEFVQQTNAWIAANPVGSGINWASSIEVAFRVIAWLWALHWCADAAAVTPSFLVRLSKALLQHGRHIEKYLSTYFSPNTHLTGEALGLLYLGTALPELREAAHWQALGLQILLEQLPRHVRADGVYFEQSSYYHRYTTDFYLHLYALLRTNQMQLSAAEEALLQQRLTGLYEHLLWLQRPDGTSPCYGDDDGGRLLSLAPRAANDFRDTLATGAWLCGRSDWKYAAGNAPAELLWLFGVEGINGYDQLPAAPPSDKARAFATSGYFAMRSGWERTASWTLVNCGRHGAEVGSGHAHADALSFEFAAAGTTWVIDPGTFVYGADVATRDWFRATAAHNTAMVDDQPQAEPGLPFAWRTTADGHLIEFKAGSDWAVLEGSQNSYQSLPDPVTHTRAVWLFQHVPCLIVHDKFAAQAQHKYTLRFHLTPDCTARAVGHRIEAQLPSDAALAITLFTTRPSSIQARIEDGWVSSCYGQRAAAPIAVFEVVSTGVTELTSTLVATASGEPKEDECD